MFIPPDTIPFLDVFGRHPETKGIANWGSTQHLGRRNLLGLVALLHRTIRSPTRTVAAAAEDQAFELLLRALEEYCGDNFPLLPRLRRPGEFKDGEIVYFATSYLEEAEMLEEARQHPWIEMTVMQQPQIGSKPSRIAMRAAQPFRKDATGEHATIGLDRDMHNTATVMPFDDFRYFQRLPEMIDQNFVEIWMDNAADDAEMQLGLKREAFRQLMLG